MKSVLHRDRVRARIVRYDKKGRPEGRVLEILEVSVPGKMGTVPCERPAGFKE